MDDKFGRRRKKINDNEWMKGHIINRKESGFVILRVMN